MPRRSKHEIEQALRRERDLNSTEALAGVIDPTNKAETDAVKLCRPRMTTLWNHIKMTPARDQEA